MENIIKDVEDYIDQLQEQFPEMSKRDLKQIVKIGLTRIRKILAIGARVAVGKKYRAAIGRRKRYIEDLNQLATIKSRIK